jgi:hypothetical protein
MNYVRANSAALNTAANTYLVTTGGAHTVLLRTADSLGDTGSC